MTRTIIIDVDGTLTDNRVYYDSKGERIKGFHSRDIRAIRELTAKGFEVILLTHSTWPGSDHFAKRTGAIVLQSFDKFQWVKDNVIGDYFAIGDDIADLKLLANATVKYCPADAEKIIKQLPNMIELDTKGGDGVIAELVKLIA